ncbi:hypothetical protein V6N12_020708 [Hibiscus sabdariffa]|uniref:Uncharacterized protein n=1 Tax=Hibiscus sabdariffa TaxID=183260 RepID=A0ABR2D1I5_9ROSI
MQDGQPALGDGFQKDADARVELQSEEPSTSMPVGNMLQRNSLTSVSAELEIPTQCNLPSVEAGVPTKPNSVTQLSPQPATLSLDRVPQSATPDFVSVSPSIRVPIVYKRKSKFLSTQQQPELDNSVLQPQSSVLPSAQNQISVLQPEQHQDSVLQPPNFVLPSAQNQESDLRPDQRQVSIFQSDQNSDQNQDHLQDCSSDMSAQEEGVSPEVLSNISSTSSSTSASSQSIQKR